MPARLAVAAPKPHPETGSPERAFVRTDSGRTLAYVESGSGRDVLLLHGTLTTADDMRLALFEDLARHFHAVALDRPSHGASDRVPLADASLWTQAAIVRDAAAALDLKRPILCGHSYGGAVALALALAYPEAVSGVVAVAPICFPEPRLEHVLFGPRVLTGSRIGSLWDPLLLPLLWQCMFLPQRMPERFFGAFPFELAGRREQTAAEGESANAMAFDLLRSVASYAGCRVPIRFVTGTADIVVNPLHSITAAAMIPDARLTIVPGAGHMLHHSSPGTVVACVEQLAQDEG